MTIQFDSNEQLRAYITPHELQQTLPIKGDDIYLHLSPNGYITTAHVGDMDTVIHITQPNEWWDSVHTMD